MTDFAGEKIACSTSRTARKTKNKMSFWKKLCICIIVLSCVAYTVWNNNSFQRKYLYPYHHRELIEYYADRYDVDKSLVAGMILAESKFDSKAISHPGAIGLMQIMPETGTWIAHQIEDEQFSVSKLHDPEMNIKYGTWYLASLEQEFYNNPVLALAAYNAGRGNVHEWIEEYGWDRNFSDYKQIPFPETREYVKRVIENEKNYQRLYQINN